MIAIEKKSKRRNLNKWRWARFCRLRLIGTDIYPYQPRTPRQQARYEQLLRDVQMPEQKVGER